MAQQRRSGGRHHRRLDPRLSVTTAGHVVDPLNVDHGLINQESQAIDSTGSPHALISYVPGRFTQCVSNFVAQRRSWGRVFHPRRTASGSWTKTELPVPLNAFGRSRLVFDASDNAYVVMPFGRVVAASRASNYTDWTLRYDAAGLNAFGEVVVDEQRVRSHGVLPSCTSDAPAAPPRRPSVSSTSASAERSCVIRRSRPLAWEIVRLGGEKPQTGLRGPPFGPGKAWRPGARMRFNERHLNPS